MSGFLWYRPGRPAVPVKEGIHRLRKLHTIAQKQYEEARLRFGEGARITQDAKHRVATIQKQFVSANVVGEETRELLLSARMYDV